MAPNKVVVKFKDSTVVKGKTSDFFPNKAQFHLEEINGEISEISIEDLKAVFFVKDYKSYTGRNPKTGQKVTISPKKLPFFKCGKELKERINNNGSGPPHP